MNDSSINQLSQWVGRKVTVTMTDRTFGLEDGKSLFGSFTDTIIASLEARLLSVTVVEGELHLNYEASHGQLFTQIIRTRGQRNGIVAHREFNRSAVEVMELTGVKVPTGMQIVTAEDCLLDGCEDHCNKTSRTEVLITLC